MSGRHIYVDLETSGLNPDQGHMILGIGAVAELGIKKREITEFSRLVRPTDKQWALAHPKALEVNGLTWERLMDEGRPLNEVKDEFCSWLVGGRVRVSTVQYVGQNPEFDIKFLKWYMNGELLLINFPMEPLTDVRDLYSILVNRKVMPYLKNRSGKNISMALGVEPEPDVHDCLEGARVVRRNYLKIVELLGLNGNK